MQTISVSELKARLSAQLRKVKAGAQIVVLEHRRPVAVLKPYVEELLLVREPTRTYEAVRMEPLTAVDPAGAMDREREDRW